MLDFIITLILLAIVGFIQNMAFTAVSRSRNAGDPVYHRKTAWLSNSIWFVCNFYILFGTMLKNITEGNHVQSILVLIVYALATAEGSTFMMKLKLGMVKFPKWLHFIEKHIVESGKRKVGER